MGSLLRIPWGTLGRLAGTQGDTWIPLVANWRPTEIILVLFYKLPHLGLCGEALGAQSSGTFSTKASPRRRFEGNRGDQGRGEATEGSPQGPTSPPMGPEENTATSDRPSFGSLRRVGGALGHDLLGEKKQRESGGRDRLQERISTRDLARKSQWTCRMCAFVLHFLSLKAYFFLLLPSSPKKTKTENGYQVKKNRTWMPG